MTEKEEQEIPKIRNRKILTRNDYAPTNIKPRNRTFLPLSPHMVSLLQQPTTSEISYLLHCIKSQEVIMREKVGERRAKQSKLVEKIKLLEKVRLFAAPLI